MHIMRFTASLFDFAIRHLQEAYRFAQCARSVLKLFTPSGVPAFRSSIRFCICNNPSVTHVFGFT